MGKSKFPRKEVKPRNAFTALAARKNASGAAGFHKAKSQPAPRIHEYMGDLLQEDMMSDEDLAFYDSSKDEYEY